jgi:hypothetical protein
MISGKQTGHDIKTFSQLLNILLHNTFTCTEDISAAVVSISLLNYNLKKCLISGILALAAPRKDQIIICNIDKNLVTNLLP